MVRAVAVAAAGQVMPYSDDPFTAAARRGLGEVFERDVDVFPVSTGSAASGLSLAALTPPWGGVLSHPGSHINHDECGARSSSPAAPSSSASRAPTAGSTPKRGKRRCAAELAFRAKRAGRLASKMRFHVPTAAAGRAGRASYGQAGSARATAGAGALLPRAVSRPWSRAISSRSAVRSAPRMSSQ